MDNGKKFSIRHFAILTACAVLGCFVLALCAVVPSFVSGARAEETPVKLSKVEVVQNDDWIVTNDTKSLGAEVLAKIFKVTLTYATGKTVTDETGETTEWTVGKPEVLEFTGFNGNTATAATGEVVAFAFEGSKLTATVTPKAGAVIDPDDTSVTTLDGSVTYKSGTRRENGIYGEYVGSGGLTTTSVVPSANIKVAYTYNDGTKQDIGSAMGADNYNIVTPSLFPNNFDINMENGALYDVAITVTLKDNSFANGTASVIIPNVEYKKSTGFSNLNVPAKAVDQIARSEFDYEGFSINALYSPRPVSVPLNTFKGIDGCLSNEYFYYDEIAGTEVSKGHSLTTQANSVKVTFIDPIREDNTITQDYSTSVTINTISIDTPTFTYYEKEQDTGDGRTAIVDFNIGLTISATLPDYSQYADNGGKPGVEFSIDKTDGVTATEDGGKQTGEYVFSKPGTFVISATLDATSADFVWGAPSGGGVRDGSNKTLSYRVQISKGKIEISSSSLADIEYVYGNLPELKPEIEAKESESGAAIANKFVLGEFSTDDNDTQYQYRMEYYGWGGFDADNRSQIAPTDAGKYKAVAVTKANLYYYSAVSDEVTVTVTPAPIEVNSVLKNPTYERGTEYAVTGSATSANTVLTDPTDLYKLTYEITGETTVTYAKAYTVDLTIGNPNYMWKGATLPDEWSDVSELTEQRTKSGETFTIGKRTIKYTVSGTSVFYYGDVKLDEITASVDSADEKYLNDPTIVYSAGAAADCNIWSKGDYTVTYAPVYGGSDSNERNSLTLVTSDAFGFTVNPATVNTIALEDKTAVYKPDGNTFYFTGWVSIKDGGLGAVTDIQDLLTRTVVGTRTGTKAPVYSDDNTQVTLFDTDVYTVTIKLPASGNFIWVGGGSADLSATWTINKATVDPLTAPDSVTYNHAAHDLELVGDWDPDLMTKVVTGERFAGGGAITVSGDDPASKRMSLTAAGKYTVEISLKDKSNYEWKKDGGNDSNDLVLTFNIDRATIELEEASSTANYQEGVDAQPLPTLRIIKKSADGGFLTDAELALTYNIKDANGEYVPDNKITKSGEYTYEFISTDGSEKYNYELTQSVTYRHKILAFDLNIPIIADDTSFIYDGNSHAAHTFITNYVTENFEGRIAITVKRGETVLIGSEVKDVYGDELAYTVSVKPAESYSWRTGEGQATSPDQEFTFTITVTRKTVNIAWGKLEATYGDNDFDPAPSVSDLCDGDVLTVVAGYKVNSSDNSDIPAFTSTTAAGRYTVYAKSFGQADDATTKNNYKIDPDATQNYSKEYTIKKQVLTLPTALEKVAGKVYDGSAQSVTYTGITADAWNYLGGKITASVTRKNEVLTDLTAVADGVFDVATGTFAFTNAGVYTVVFEIADKDNYCLNSAYQYDFDETDAAVYFDTRESFITVARKSVTAPDLTKKYRDQEWKTAEDFSASILTGQSDGVAYKTEYYGTDGTKLESLGGVGKQESDRGTYSIVLKIDGADMLNYVWKSAAINKPQYSEKTDELTYSASEVSIRIYYTIIGSKLVVEYEIIDGGYTFGDNGSVANVNGGDPLKSGIDSLVRLTANSETLIEKTENVGEITLERIVFKNGDIIVEESDLENGLPWNAGEYTVSFDVKFGDGMVYQTLPIDPLTFTVARRVIDVVWSDTSAVYNGGEQVATATLQNVPERGGAQVALPTLNVTVDGTDDKPKNADTYTLSVRSLSGDNKDNFTVTGAATTPFTISPYAVSVKGNPVTAVYGDELPSGTTAWVYVGDNRFYDSTDHIAVYITTVAGDVATATNKPVAGITYYVTLAWDDKDAAYAKNYSVTFDSSAVYTVSERNVTVALAPVETTYYDEVNTYKDAAGNYLSKYYMAEATNGADMTSAFVYGDVPFAITSAVGQNSAANTDGYVISATQNNDNYIITFVCGGNNYTLDELNGGVYKHVVNKATLTVDVSAIADFSYDATDRELIASKTESGRDLGNNDFKWLIAEVGKDVSVAPTDDASWIEYDPDIHVAKDADTYCFFVKATANNHTDSNVAGKFTVVVSPAKLIASVTGYETGYDAKNHEYLAFSSVTGADLNNNVPQWYIYLASKDDASAPAADAAGWEQYNAVLTHFAKDAGEYYFYAKVEASNHGAEVLSSGGKAFKITVTKAVITIQMNLSIFYGEENPAKVSGYMKDIADLTKTENKNIFVIEVGDFKSKSDMDDFYGKLLVGGTFSYAIPSYSQGDAVSLGGVTYTVTFDGSGLTSTNYTFAGKNGLLEVKPLPVMVVVDDCSAKFNQVAPAAPAVKSVTTEQKSTYDDSVISVWNASGVVTGISTDALKGEGGYTTNIVKYDADKKIIGYDITIETSRNYSVTYNTAKYTIERADNAIKGDYSLFENAHSWKDGDVDADTTTVAWVYGRYDANDNANGYDKGGKQKLNTLELLCADNELAITISRGDKVLATGSAAAGGNATEKLASLFDGIYNAAGALTFFAGEYSVKFETAVASNYEAFAETWRFKVDRKDITVTPEDIALDYGNDIQEPAAGVLHTNKYSYTYDALSGYATDDDISKIVAFAFGSEFDLTNAAKRRVGDYAITVAVTGNTTVNDGNTVFTSDNYVFTFGTATLTVSQREIKINISAAENRYMLLGDYIKDGLEGYYESETPYALDYGFAEDSKYDTFYTGETPFTLNTDALKTYIDGVATETADYGKYAIYAKYASAEFKHNYNIIVTNAAADGVEPPAEIGELVISGYGVFSVEKARLRMAKTGPYYEDELGSVVEGAPADKKFTKYASEAVGLVYDGKAKHYFATPNLGNRKDDITDVPSFEPVYSVWNGTTWETVDGAPADKAQYKVEFLVVGTNENFIAIEPEDAQFTIAAQSLTVSAQITGGTVTGDGSVTYSGGEFTVTFTFAGVVGDEVLKLVTTVDGKNFDNAVISSTTIAPGQGGNANNVLTVKAVKAGTYGVSVKLDDSDEMKNYALAGTGVSNNAYGYKLTVNKATLYIWVQDASVEYGTQIFENDGKLVDFSKLDADERARFTGFNIAYSLQNYDANHKPTSTDTALQSIINTNIAEKDLVTDKNGVMYTAANYRDGSNGDPSAAGQSGITIDAPNFKSNNFTVIPDNISLGTLTVKARKIQVEVKGAGENNKYAVQPYDGTTGHENRLNHLLASDNAQQADVLAAFFTASANAFGKVKNDSLASLGISVNILGSEVKNVAEYSMQPTWTNGNYAVEFTYGDTTIGGANYPKYRIEKIDLFVKAHHKDDAEFLNAEFESKKAVIPVVYGEALSDYKVMYYGWVSDEGNSTGSALLGGMSYSGIDSYVTAYSAYDSHVGEKLTILPKNILDNMSTLGNYKITYLPADINITPRPISVTAPSREFIPEIENNYGNYGAYGKACAAEVKFDGVEQSRMGGLYSLKYDGSATVPTKAGTYAVTVTVQSNGVAGGTYYDYKFGNGNNFTDTPFTVNKKLITDFDWSRKSIKYDEADKTNTITEFVASVMSVTEFNDGSVSITLGADNLTDTGLIYEATGVGTYTITVVLRESAKANFKWNSDDTQISAIKEFIVTSSGLVEIVDLTMSGWTYRDSAVTPDAELQVIGTTTRVDGVITYWYAKVSTGGDDVTVAGSELAAADVNGYAHDEFALSVPTDAGVYILQARFDGNANYPAADRKYYIFRIARKSIAKPDETITGDVYGETEDGTGSVTSSAIAFDSSIMQVIKSDVHYSVDENGITFDTVNANASGYDIVIKLIDTDNCMWSDGTVDNVTVKWIVSVATDNTVAWASQKQFEHEYGEDTADLSVTTKYNYNRTVSYWHVSDSGFTLTEDQVKALEPDKWTGGTPTDAGDYWIRAVVRSADGNYTAAYAYHKYVVNKAALRVTASGAMTYGDPFDGSAKAFEFVDQSEFKFDRDGAAVRLQIEQSISYSLKDTDTSGLIAVGSDYALVFTATASNYDIVCVEGAFVVSKRTLDVVINPAASVYGDEFASLTARISGFAADESKDAVDGIIAGINAALEKAEGTDADVYAVTLPASFALDNYALNVTDGMYTISRLPVRLTVENGGGVFNYNGEGVVLPSVTSATAGDKEWIESVKQFVKFNFNGITYENAARADAGSYAFSVTLDDCNFVIDGQAVGTFVITKQTLDATRIEWNDVYYNGEANNHPTVKNNPFGDVFDIEFDGEWKYAGVPYVVRLKLKNTDNTMWAAATDETGVYREITNMTIKRGKNSLVSTEEGKDPVIEIIGWTYGGYTEDNAPHAVTAFGDSIRYEYSTTADFEAGTVLDGTPVDAGTYYVRAVVEGSDNWERFESPSFEFTVSPLMYDQPTLGIYSETGGGHYKNDTYTGSELGFEVFGFDSTLMEISYDGTMIVRGNGITLLATNAGSYSAVITLKNGRNFNWSAVAAYSASGYDAAVDGNTLTITWTIAKKKLAMPTANDHTYIVNGSELEYIPEGFDADTMYITGNVSGYGGDFKAYVSIIDTNNYEWANGSLEAVVIEWHVVGADALFAILVSIFAVLAVGAGAFMSIELYKYLQKRKSGKGNGNGSGNDKPSAGEPSKADEKTESAETVDTAENAENAENAQAQDSAQTNNEGTVTA